MALRSGAPATRGRCGPLSRERPSQPGGCFSPSRALSSRPHIRVWSAAAAVSVRAGASGAGPGRNKWRRREAERRPRSAQSPRNFRLEAPELSGKCCRSGGVDGRGSRGGKSGGKRRGAGETRTRGGGGGGVCPCLAPPRPPPPSPRPSLGRGAGAGAARRAEPGTAQGLAGGGAPSLAGPPPRVLRALLLGRPPRA